MGNCSETLYSHQLSPVLLSYLTFSVDGNSIPGTDIVSFSSLLIFVFTLFSLKGENRINGFIHINKSLYFHFSVTRQKRELVIHTNKLTTTKLHKNYIDNLLKPLRILVLQSIEGLICNSTQFLPQSIMELPVHGTYCR